MVLVVLWTDVLLFMLAALGIAFAIYAGRHEHLRAPWRRVARRPAAMSAAVLLVFFVVVALVDSVHFHPREQGLGGDGEPRYSSEVLSLLDVALTPLRTRVEKTYSAPLAAHLYARESVELGNGRKTREFPRLRYGGRHLQDPQRERLADILVLTLRGLALGISIWLFVCAIVLIGLARRHGRSGGESIRRILGCREDLPWLGILLTLGVLVCLCTIVAALAPHYHVLGTDKVGQDVLYQALKSVRTGLAFGTLTTFVMLPLGVLLGIMAGYFRGWVDDVIQYLYTTLNSIPSVLLIAAVVLILDVHMAKHAEAFASLEVRADLRLLFLCMILGVMSWTGLCRLLRAETLKVREMGYIQSATAFGAGHFSIIGRHILPNVLHIVLITVVLDFSGLVLVEAVLSYLSIGVDPSMASWGNMINGARLEMAREPVVWWSLAAAFVFMLALVLPANLFADAVRDAFDPRLRVH